jgi:hypothetical protein
MKQKLIYGTIVFGYLNSECVKRPCETPCAEYQLVLHATPLLY